jgi:hypothetical protein
MARRGSGRPSTAAIDSPHASERRTSDATCNAMATTNAQAGTASIAAPTSRAWRAPNAAMMASTAIGAAIWPRRRPTPACSRLGHGIE